MKLEEGEGKSGEKGRGREGGLDLGTHSCCHRGEPASTLKRGGYRWGLNSPPFFARGRRFFKISYRVASPRPHTRLALGQQLSGQKK